ncbi:hypothetical protein OROHE_014383 [Orobanche hederae]
MIYGLYATKESCYKHFQGNDETLETLNKVWACISANGLKKYISSNPETYNARDVCDFYNNAVVGPNKNNISTVFKGKRLNLSKVMFCTLFELNQEGTEAITISESEAQKLYKKMARDDTPCSWSLTTSHLKPEYNLLVNLVSKIIQSKTSGFDNMTREWFHMMHWYSPLPISAISGTGLELLDLVCSGLKKIENPDELAEEEDYVPAIAIVGRPNVGKSSILNALVGEVRTIVSPVSGTTRDAIDIEFTGPDGQKFRLIDTAGIRRKAVVASSGSVTEALSVNRAFRAIRRSDVVALVIEAMSCITEQDNLFKA